MKQRQITGILYGWIIVIGLTFIASLIIALLLKFSSLNEPTLSWVTLFAGFASLFIGGFVAGIKGQKNGWVIGLITGIGFTIFTFLMQYLGFKQGFTMEQGLQHIGYITIALIGGVLGVNLITKDQ